MVITIPSGAQVIAFTRHIGNSAGTTVAVLALLTQLSPEQQIAIINAIHQVTEGFSSVVAGLSFLTPFVTGAFAALSASTKKQVVAVKNNPDFDVVPVTPAGAAVIDSIKK